MAQNQDHSRSVPSLRKKVSAPATLSLDHSLGLAGNSGVVNGPEILSPDKLPDPWLIDSEYLLGELARIRRLALLVPTTTKKIDLVMPVNTVIDAVWRLEEQLRYLLHLHREGQRSFAQRHVSATPDVGAGLKVALSPVD